MQNLSAAWLHPLILIADATITANMMSFAINHVGMFGIEQPSLNVWRTLGGAPMTGGIVLIALF